MTETTVYLAGPLFGIADQVHNLLLAKELTALGYSVLIPQVMAKKTADKVPGVNPLSLIIDNCKRGAMSCDVVVANIDGADADSGTAVEIGLALGCHGIHNPGPKVVCYRTDFRTDMGKEIGYNGMFMLAHKMVYYPANITRLSQCTRFYAGLAKAIDESIREVLQRG